MDVVLYRNTAPPNKVDKSANLSGKKTFENVHFIEKGALSILEPEVLVKIGGEVEDIAKYNYMKIGKFNRYYYIDAITTEGGLFRIKGRVDSLMSHKMDILNSKQYVLRQETKYKNPYLFDNLLPITSDHNYYGKSFGDPVFKKDCGYVLLATTGIGGRVVPN